jgi:hypothetical protein
MQREPSVACVMLTRDRREMTTRAVRSFRAQTYSNKTLLIWDTSAGRPFELSMNLPENERCFEDVADYSIGILRNRANSRTQADIIVHLDSDDWSHPNRIAEQVAFLQASGCDAVGYREMLFWDTAASEAWLYANTDPVYCLGTSLCYWRGVWQERPFPDKTTGEDFFWLQGLNGQKRLNSRGQKLKPVWRAPGHEETEEFEDEQPRMIATIHGGNIASRIQPGTMEWRRVPTWDDVVRRTLGEA